MINQPNQAAPTFVNRYTGEIVSNQKQFNYNRKFTKNNFKSQEQDAPQVSAFSAIFKDNFESESELIEKEAFPKPFLFQIHKKYIISQTANGFIIIDQHAAHERVLYERAKKSIKKASSNSQQLLFKINISLNAAERSIFKLIQEELASIGFVFNPIEESGIELTAVPIDIKPGQEESSIKEILEQYQEFEKIMKTDKQDLVAASFACKAAIKTGESLSLEEMKSLLEELNICDNPSSCPHGRPTIIEFPMTELDRRFGRI